MNGPLAASGLLDGGVSSVGWIAGYGLTVIITRCVGAVIRSLFFDVPDADAEAHV